jgi:hypothetical protein
MRRTCRCWGDAGGCRPRRSSEARDDAELVHLDRTVRTLHALNFLLEREQHGGFLSLNVHPS